MAKELKYHQNEIGFDENIFWKVCGCMWSMWTLSVGAFIKPNCPIDYTFGIFLKNTNQAHSTHIFWIIYHRKQDSSAFRVEVRTSIFRYNVFYQNYYYFSHFWWFIFRYNGPIIISFKEDFHRNPHNYHRKS